MHGVQDRLNLLSEKISEFRRALLSKSSRSNGSPRAIPQIIAIVGEGPDRKLIESISREFSWPLRFAASPEEAMAEGGGAISSVILFDRDLPDSDWRAGLRLFRERTPRPYVILLSQTTDLNLWDELQRVGGYDLLRTPLTSERLRWAIQRASAVWQSNQEARQPL